MYSGPDSGFLEGLALLICLAVTAQAQKNAYVCMYVFFKDGGEGREERERNINM